VNNQSARRRGAVYTPPDFAKFLSEWAIQTPDDKVLDIGVGEGAITFAAYERLRALGATARKAGTLLYGAEIDRATFQRFGELSALRNLQFPRIVHANFFRHQFPTVNAVVGNPPFVRRSKIVNYRDLLRAIKSEDLTEPIFGLTDLSIYFLFKACNRLREGGRLAIITSDSWLNARYGGAFKRYLLSNFKIDHLIAFDRNVFEVDVRTVITLATKTSSRLTFTDSNFLRVRNGLQPSCIFDNAEVVKSPDVVQRKVTGLRADDYWGEHFRKTRIFEELKSHPTLIDLGKVAFSRIGLQTLAKDFFILDREKARAFGIERRYLRPLLPSLRTQRTPVAVERQRPDLFVVWCDEPKKRLRGTNLLRYITHAERKRVAIRGKNRTVVGFQNKKRIRRSGRQPWYNLKSEMGIRPKARILIPRFIYENYYSVWNRAEFLPAEYFIEFHPLLDIKEEVYLAALSSSLFEMCLRSCSTMYGGGAYSVSPGRLKSLPFPNLAILTANQRRLLADAYSNYLAADLDRSKIDSLIYSYFSLSRRQVREIEIELNDLRRSIVTNTK
jgi:hypothetical protein